MDTRLTPEGDARTGKTLMTPPVVDTRFLLAVVLLVGFFTSRSWADFRKNGRAATQWRDYAWLFGVACTAAIFGAVNDRLTAGISPEYFVLGKGLPQDAAFHLRVMALGAEAGFAAGMVAGAVLLFANNPVDGRHPLTLRSLTTCAGLTMFLAAGTGALAGVSPPEWSPLRLPADFATSLSPRQIAGFETVWRIHLGIYIGLALGLMAAVAYAIRSRSR